MHMHIHMYINIDTCAYLHIRMSVLTCLFDSFVC